MMYIDELANMGVDVEEIRYLLDKYQRGQNVIVATGEFNAGKSTFINCYLNRKDFLPSAMTECTPILIDLSEGEEEYIEVRTIDGNIEQMEYSVEAIQTYAKYDESATQDVVSISVPVFNSGLPGGTHLIDTPGTNTVLKEHKQLTNYIIRKADVVLYLFDRVIAQTDVSHITEIYQHTNNIIYVMTHTDKIDDKTNRKYTETRIAELISEAKKEIARGTSVDVEDILMYDIGSIDGLESRSKIDVIRETVTEYVERQTNEKRRRITQKKIESVINKTIDSLFVRKELLNKEGSLRRSEIEKKINKYEHEKSLYKRKYEERLSDIDRSIGRSEESCKDRLTYMLAQSRESIQATLEFPGLDEESLGKQIERKNQEISSAIRIKIEEDINGIVKRAYESVNGDLADLAEEFEISRPLKLEIPVIDDLNDRRLLDKLINIEKDLEQTVCELEELRNHSQPDRRDEIEKQIHEYEGKKEEIREQLIQLGAYRPEYELVEIEGGRKQGRVIGQILGEFADMALLVWNPAGAVAGAAKGASEVSKATKVAKAVDKAKDAATIMRYAGSALSSINEKKKETDEKKAVEKKVSNKIKDVDGRRREMIDNIQRKAWKGETDQKVISTMLDMLSIGFWTKKIGGVIGEAIDPTRLSEVENLEHKEEYERIRKTAVDESNRLVSEISDLKNKLLEIDDIGKQRRMERELQEKERILTEKKQQIENLIRQGEQEHKEKEIIDYIHSCLENYEESQKNSGEQLIHAIFDEAKTRLVERITVGYHEKISEFNDMLIELRADSGEVELKVAKYGETIKALSDSINYVGMWLE